MHQWRFRGFFWYSKRMNESLEKSKTALKEEEILAFWEKNEIFQKTIDKEAPNGTYVFYDGPPFATGLPHYGHLMQGTVKDAIPRYQTMKGKSVRRQWGWDCHGLPIENLMEKELSLKNKQDIEDYGIERFNEAAKSSVLRYDTEWKEIVPRVGRFIDMDKSYKTMDWTYSESIWWAFDTLYKKGLIYEGYKAMHICPRCETTLANSEVAQGYKDVKDISAIAKFELVDEPGTYVLAWTTTPWTLPGNVALAVGEDIEYIKIKNLPEASIIEEGKKVPVFKREYYWVSKDVFDRKATAITKRDGDEQDIFSFEGVLVKKTGEKEKGAYFVGEEYRPLFGYFAEKEELENKKNGWKIYAAKFVTTEEGTGVVHIAPAFGEDDMNLGKEKELPFVQHVKMNGMFTDDVTDFKGLYVKPKDAPQSTDIEIIKHLAHEGTLFHKEKYEHSYPHCWRCDTPLLNYAASSWFVKVTALKDKIIEENNKVRWIPETVKTGRFGKWLEGARDWAISRSRYWGAPLPVWKCDSCEEVHSIGSIAELQEKLPRSKNTYHIVRHGEAESNVNGIVSSKVGNPHRLTEKGKEQAKQAAGKLRDANITHIFASDFVRTRETAEIIAEELGLDKTAIIFDERLREIQAGDMEGKPVQAYYDYFASIEEQFKKALPNGETAEDIKTRMADFLFDIDSKYKNANILVVSHEHPLWLLAAGSKGMDAERAAALKGEKEREFIVNGEVRELPFMPFPHNNEYEIDLHRPYIDEVVYPCSCGGTMKRIEDVFDCWFESGSMPYSQFHYPFENEDLFKQNFPADFIAEGLDQTRGWFYTLLVLSVGLFDKSPYRNVMGTGLILAEDGQKMSKRLKNYPDPLYIVNKYGADALRYYILSSPVIHGEELRFSEKGVDEVFKKITLRLNNVYSFYEMYAGEDVSRDAYKKSDNVLDAWMVSRLSECVSEIEKEMDRYQLDKAVRPIMDCIDDLSTWYVRRSRDRFKAEGGEDKMYALSTTRYALETIARAMAPFMPFIAEQVYRDVKASNDPVSVHLADWPELPKADNELLQNMKATRSIVEAGLSVRAKAGIKVRQPLQTLSYTGAKLSDAYEALIQDEVNVKEVKRVEKMEGGVSLNNITVSLDVEITEELRQEGYLRELLRRIQDLRKKEGLMPGDGVVLAVTANDAGKKEIEMFEGEIKQVTNTKDIVMEASVEGEEIVIGPLVYTIKLRK
jgi:isoleucyl-tRNA synthetase